MPSGDAHIESIEHLTKDEFILTFSDGKVVILTGEQIEAQYADQRTLARHIDLSKVRS